MDSVRNKWVKLSDKDGYKRKNSKAGDPGMLYRMQVRGKAGTGKTYHTRYLKLVIVYHSSRVAHLECSSGRCNIPETCTPSRKYWGGRCTDTLISRLYVWCCV